MNGSRNYWEFNMTKQFRDCEILQLQHVHTKSVCRVFSHSHRSPDVSICYHVFPPFPVFPVPPVCVCVCVCVCDGLFLLFIVHSCLRSAHCFSSLSSLRQPTADVLICCFTSAANTRQDQILSSICGIFSPLSLCFLVLNACFPHASGSSTHLSTRLQPPSHHAAFVIPNRPRLLLAHASPASAIAPPRPLFPHHRSSPPFPICHKQTSSSSNPSAVTVLCTGIPLVSSTRSLLVQQSDAFILKFGYSQLLMLEWKRFWSRLMRASCSFCRWESCQTSDFNIWKRDTAGYFLRRSLGRSSAGLVATERDIFNERSKRLKLCLWQQTLQISSAKRRYFPHPD